MPSYCVVPFCKNRGGYHFPSDKDLFAKWVVAVRRKNWQPTQYSRVCSSHFVEDDFHAGDYTLDGSIRLRKSLRATAVPSVFHWSIPDSATISARKVRKRHRDESRYLAEMHDRQNNRPPPPVVYDGYPGFSEVAQHTVVGTAPEASAPPSTSAPPPKSTSAPPSMSTSARPSTSTSARPSTSTSALPPTSTSAPPPTSTSATSIDTTPLTISIDTYIPTNTPNNTVEYVHSHSEEMIIYDATSITSSDAMSCDAPPSPPSHQHPVCEENDVDFLHSSDVISCDSPPPPSSMHQQHQHPVCDDNGQALEDDVDICPVKFPGYPPEEVTAVKRTLKEVHPINQDIYEMPYMCVRRLQSDDKEIHRYTGLGSYLRFKTVFWTLGNNVNHLSYVYSSSDCPLSPEDCFLLMCVKLRHNTAAEELARGFSISVTSVTSIFYTWVKFCSRQWGQVNLWPERKVVDYYFPSDFQAKYKNTRVIVDATEIPIRKPSNPTAQRASFSSYKHRNTVKVLVGTTPGGAVSFISQAFGGSASDRQIVERSNLKELCEPGDSIMADKGFNVQDIFAPKDIHVNLPTFFKKKNRMDQETVHKDKKISSKRVHIERTIGSAKVYKILRSPLNACETLLCDDIIRVCFFLYNFRDRIVSSRA